MQHCSPSWGSFHGLLIVLVLAAQANACAASSAAGTPGTSAPRPVASVGIFKAIQPTGKRAVFPVAYRFNTRLPRLYPPDDVYVNCGGGYESIPGPFPGHYVHPPSLYPRLPVPIGCIVRYVCDEPGISPVKYEISWGEGPGGPNSNSNGIPIWTDVTVEAQSWDLSLHDGIRLNGISKFNYVGNTSLYPVGNLSNRIRARITFSDGVVVQSRPADEPIIDILPEAAFESTFRENWVAVFLNTGGSTFEYKGTPGLIIVEAGPPVTVGVVFGGDGFAYDCEDKKLEIDWKDGSGWQDVTEEARAWGNPLIGELSKHTYTANGLYQINCRRTFWDGETLESDHFPEDSHTSPLVIVGPPPPPS
jgi:hypothetical protein